MITLGDFCDLVAIEKISPKTAQAVMLIFYAQRSNGQTEVDIAELDDLFHRAGLPRLDRNRARFAAELLNSRRVHKGDRKNSFRVPRETYRSLCEKFNSEFDAPSLAPEEKANIDKTPLLTPDEVASARKMASMYMIVHCFENSARKLIEKVMIAKFGPNWWDKAATARMKEKYNDRKGKEQKNKWITSRGSSPLYYIDWGDLQALMHNYESDFIPAVHDYAFVEARFPEMEKLRNIIAHNGTLPSDDEFQHVVLMFRQWCKQLA